MSFYNFFNRHFLEKTDKENEFISVKDLPKVYNRARLLARLKPLGVDKINTSFEEAGWKHSNGKWLNMHCIIDAEWLSCMWTTDIQSLKGGQTWDILKRDVIRRLYKRRKKKKTIQPNSYNDELKRLHLGKYDKF